MTNLNSRRAMVQWLEGLRRAGVRSLPRGSSSGGARAAEDPEPAEISDQSNGRQPASPAGPDQTLKSVAPATAVPVGKAAAADAARDAGLFPESTPPKRQPAAKVPDRSTTARAERVERLRELAGCVAACQRCGELASTRTQTVFGVGNPEARMLFIGEAPGADEDRQGEPFVGKAGQLLDRIIAACRMRREDVYICNVLKCRPPGNRTPSDEEAAHCREFLDGQIAVVDPDYIVCWGAVAARNLLETKAPIGRLRGRFFQHGRARVLCTYHPSYLLRNPAAKKDVWDDMQFLFRDMGIDLSDSKA
ncbi:MAG: uracil-DNA glycosylase [Planctomycetes bacterium]|nr:uracil-DNA glycosylase [Planctomycetota bacterium]